MSNALPQGDRVRKAVKWISAQLLEDSQLPLNKLIQEAITQYDLNPYESEMLIQFYRDNN